jgi:Transglutaminase-like superfamily/Domain of Unknown Function with PDB structure (DUF3857)
MRSITWRGLVAALCFLIVLPAAAQAPPAAAAHMKVNRTESTLRFAADASVANEYLVEREALSEQGTQIVGKFSLGYHTGLQRHEILEAYTAKADGRRLAVAPEAIQVQSGVASGGTAPSMPEVSIVVVTFPDVRTGDHTVVRGRMVTHTSYLKGWGFASDFIFPGLALDNVSTRIEAPAALGLNVVATGMTQSHSRGGDTEVWELRGAGKAQAPERNSVNVLSTIPRFLASTWKTHAQLGDAYAVKVSEKAVVTPQVQQLAGQITQGKIQRRDKVAAIHDWVRTNIRYVAVYLGTGGFVPHDVGWILQNRYGDCKDKALLMITLLKAVGIEAVPVLINTGAEYVLPELPTAVSFNHCIVFIPELDQFADPTDGRIPFGSLPMADSDKPVAVGLTGGTRMLRTPALRPDGRHTVVRSLWKVAADGKATGQVRVETSGEAATQLQDRLAQVAPEAQAQFVQALLNAAGARGTGTATYPAVQRVSQTQALDLELQVRNFLEEPQAGNLSPNPTLNLPFFILSNMGNYAVDDRATAMACVPMRVREEFEIRMDPAFKLRRVPENLRLVHEDGLAFEAQYKLEANVLTGWRELTASQQRHWCSPTQYANRKAMMQRVVRHLRGTLLYEQ